MDESELLKALQIKIRGAALDVFISEPLESEHPFWTMENVLVTPHALSKTNMYMDRALKYSLIITSYLKRMN